MLDVFLSCGIACAYEIHWIDLYMCYVWSTAWEYILSGEWFHPKSKIILDFYELKDHPANIESISEERWIIVVLHLSQKNHLDSERRVLLVVW